MLLFRNLIRSYCSVKRVTYYVQLHIKFNVNGWKGKYGKVRGKNYLIGWNKKLKRNCCYSHVIRTVLIKFDLLQVN